MGILYPEEAEGGLYPTGADMLIPSMRNVSGNTYPPEKLKLHSWQTPKGG